MSDPALLADPMSGTKANALVACWYPKVVLCDGGFVNDEFANEPRSAHHENNEERKVGHFKGRHKTRPVPERKCGHKKTADNIKDWI